MPVPPPGDLTLDVEVGPDEITADDVLAEFLAVLREGSYRVFRHPGDFPAEERVMLPGPGVLAEHAEVARLWARMIAAGRM